VQWIYERMDRGFPNPIHASPILYVPPPPQNTPPRAKAIVPVRRQLFRNPSPDFFSSPQSPNMLVPHAPRLHQLSPRSLIYSLTQHVPPQEPAELNIGGESETTQYSNNNEVSNEMEWVDDGNDDEELHHHMDIYECCTPVLR
jgi:hypothetical protein